MTYIDFTKKEWYSEIYRGITVSIVRKLWEVMISLLVTYMWNSIIN